MMQPYLLVWETSEGNRHSTIVEATDEGHARALVPAAPADAEVVQGTMLPEEPAEPVQVTEDARTMQYPGYKYNPDNDTWERDSASDPFDSPGA